jgi:hypothetical protein
MIPSYFFELCKDLPPKMAACLGRPWVNLGQVRLHAPRMTARCRRCQATPPSVPGNDNICHFEAFILNDSITDVTVYFGTCEKCGTPHYAQTEERPMDDKPA